MRYLVGLLLVSLRPETEKTPAMKNRTLTIGMLFTVFAAMALISMHSCGSRHTAAPGEYAEYIKAYTGGAISSASSIRIEFTSEAKIPEDEDGILTFRPGIKGKTRWISPRILEFIPDEGELEPGRSYSGKLQLHDLFRTIDSRLKTFTFGFTVRPKDAVLKISETRIKKDDPGTASVTGSLELSEPASAEEIEGLVECRHMGRKHKVSIRQENGSSFSFTAEGLARTENDSKAEFIFDGKKKGYQEKRTAEATVPAKDSFRVLESSMENRDPMEITVQFSEPLDGKADYSGLAEVSVPGRAIIETDDNLLRMFVEKTGKDRNTVLSLSPFMKDSNGRMLGTEYTHEFSLEEIKPQVHIPLQGSILPDSGNLTLMFSAAQLNAVDLSIVKIYEDNILMFLQTNSLDGNNELRRSGRLVHRETLRLDADPTVNLHRLQNFSVDLKGIFSKEAGAIYHMTLSFRQEYSIYGKGNGMNDGYRNTSLVQLGERSISEKDMEAWDIPQPYYYEDSYDWSQFNWNETEDPEKPSYYMLSSRKAECNLMMSDLGIIAKSADGRKYDVTVTDIMTAEPAKNATVKAYSFQLQEMSESVTDSDGAATLECNGKPFVITAEKGNSRTYLKVQEGMQKSTSRFDTGGKTTQKGLKACIYGDRGVWRPGDSIHLTMVLADRNKVIPDSHPVSMELYTPAGQYYSRTVCTEGTDGFYRFSIATDDEDPTGTWNARFKAGGASFDKSVIIESIRPNRLKVNLQLPDGIVNGGERHDIGLSANWLTGPAASGLEGKVDCILRKTSRPFRGYEDYTFNDPASEFSSYETNVLEGRLDGNGEYRKEYMFPPVPGAPGMLSATFISSVTEPGGDISTVSSSSMYSPFSAYVGIRLPEEGDMIETDTDHYFDVAVLDCNGKKVKGHNMEYRIYKMEWSWWWENSRDRIDSYVNGTSADAIASGRFISGNGDDRIRFRVDYPEWGRYLVYVKDLDSGHASGRTIYADWPAWRGRSLKQDPDGVTMLSFSTDRDTCKVGEDVTVYIPAACRGKALVSVENGSGIISRKWVETDSMKETRFTVKVTEEMTPNFYIHISLLQPYKGKDNDMPLRLYGVMPVFADNPESRLHPQISVPETVRPLEEFRIRIKEKDGRPMTYTLAVVDEGLLDITGFRTPDPWTEMNAREALGVSTWDMFDDVIGGFSGTAGPLLSIGGDEYAFRDRNARDNRFNPVAVFKGPYTLEGGTAEHDIKLPMYIGSVRIMLVCGHDGAYGNAERTVTVKSPLMILPSLPASLAEGETVSLPVNVFASEEKVKTVKVRVSAEGPLSVTEGTERNLTFEKPGDRTVQFRLRTTGEGPARITVTAEGGGYRATEKMNIQVAGSSVPVKEWKTAVVEKGKSATVRFSPGKGKDDRAELQISGLPSMDFNGTFEEMLSYPYGCTEQLVSRGMAMLRSIPFLSEGNRTAAEKAIPEILAQITRRQLPDGGFGYWPGASVSDEWISSMACELFAAASESGTEVNAGTVKALLSFQKKAARNYRNSNGAGMLNQAYRLYTMALSHEADMGAMNRLKENPGIDAVSANVLAAAYATAGKKDIASDMIGDLPSAPAYGTGSAGTYGTEARDMALAVRTLALCGRISEAVDAARTMTEEYMENGHYLPQNAAFCTAAMEMLSRKVSGGVLSAEIMQEGQSAEKIRSVTGMHVSEIDAADGSVTVRNLSDGPVYAGVLACIEKPAASVTGNGGNIIEMETAYFNEAGERISAESLAHGETFIAEMTVKNTSKAEGFRNLALTFRKASGWNMFSYRLYGHEETLRESEYDWKDIRDDRAIYHFGLAPGESKTFRMKLTASYRGEFTVLPSTCEDMYRPEVSAHTGSFTSVTE